MQKVTLYTDGACRGNPGPGGWAAILMYNGHVKELFDVVPDATNQRMELLAAINGLKALKKACDVQVLSDSKYVTEGMNSWRYGWRSETDEDGKTYLWNTRQKKRVANDDLWMELFHIATLHQITWTWVRGHAGDEWNERADKLARNAIRDARF